MAAVTLNALGAILIASPRPNFNQATTVIRSSLVLSHRCEDFFSKLHSVNLLAIVYDKKKDVMHQSYNSSYRIKQQKLYNDALNEARKSPLVTTILTKFIDHLLCV
eukprot:TRINITY_DN8353_c0_g1_i1.p1 TRINITY_DN8353_c0_g1~~TRINITY_DN8353_c0_g1_i1.p1  ORF type:complete len:120 (+),score=20.55 TRINITY_DN8353_c0_g1_i1:44-361(+)